MRRPGSIANTLSSPAPFAIALDLDKLVPGAR
jgi:hypothetical protein